MGLKMIGIILVVSGCSGFGIKMAISHIRQEQCLKQLLRIIDYMECDLRYRLASLPDLCREAAKEGSGSIRKVFIRLAEKLDLRTAPDVEQCMIRVLAEVNEIPEQSISALKLLGSSLGHFDLEGQLIGLESVRQECKLSLENLQNNRDVRIRNYKTLGLCAGAALAILLL